MTRRNDGDMNGGVTLPREPMSYGEVPGISGTASFSGSVSNISARYIGKALFYNGGGGQTGRAGQTLPLSASVKVLDETTNSPVTGNVQIAFYITDPNGVVTGLGQAWKDYYSGIADKAIPLGLIPGTYTITAICPDYICIEGGRTVTMTAVVRGKALVCVDCAYHGRVSRELENPFRLKVVDMFDGSAVKGSTVTYEFLRFTAPNGNTDSNPRDAAVTQVLNAQSDIYGLSRARLKLGTEEGVYTVRARCDSCLAGQEQIPTGTAHHRTIVIETEEETAGDPTPNQEPCPSGCCPYTPVVRAMAQTLNGGRTFTSAGGENSVQLGAVLRPTCLMNQGAQITWAVQDDPDDHINSGTPAQPQPGFSRFFDVGTGIFPTPQQGRALPLAYKITANYNYNGDIITGRPLRVKQDEIDKCRQEYVDYGIPLTEVSRSTFTIGTHPQYSQDVLDCYSYIYPAKEAQKISNLKAAGYQLKVTSGYRSPRANKILIGASISSTRNSTHIFGQAVDMRPIARNSPSAWRELWEAGPAICPKSLERSPIQIMKLCNGAATQPYDGSFYPGSYDAMFPLATCIHMGNSSKLYE